MAQVNTYGDWIIGVSTTSPTLAPMLTVCNGYHLTFFWNQLEPTQNTWDWNYFDSRFQYCVNNNINIGFMVYAGQNCPSYIFSNGVPQVLTTLDGSTIFPYYLHPFYTSRYYNMLAQVITHVQAYPNNWKQKILEWQSAEGTTGDEVPWHGQPLPAYSAYAISDTDWETFKRGIWTYLAGQIASSLSFLRLLINQGNNGMDYQWTLDNVPNGWMKAGDFSHAYSFPGESEYAGRLQACRASAASNNRWRGELDNPPTQTSWWQTAPNKNAFALVNSCLYAGLDILNLFTAYFPTTTTNNYAYNYFNRFAGKRLASGTDTGFCQFRDVIDLADATRFPEGVYGNVIDPSRQTAYNGAYAFLISQGFPAARTQWGATNLIILYMNPTRVTNIRAAFPSALYLPVDTTRRQDAYNSDYSINSIPDNYYLFLTQFNPNGTTKSYWRVGTTSEFHGRYCRAFDVATMKNAIYMIVNTGIIGNFSYVVKVRVTYYNSGTNQWTLFYWNGSAKVSAGTVAHTNTNTFIEHEFDINNFWGGGHLANGADYTIENTNATNTIFSQTEFQRVSQNAIGIPPTAEAGANQTITAPTSSVTVNASASTAGSGTIVSYLWSLVSGSGSSISTPNNVSTNITGLTTGVYIYQVLVTNSNGLTDTDSVTITVNPASPIAEAGANQTITAPTSSVTVNASASAPVSGTITSYLWSKISGTGGTIVTPSNVSTNITGLTAGTYVFQVLVTNSYGLTNADSLTIVVNPGAPVANAGSNQTITKPTSSANVSASGSVATSGTITSYLWTQLSGTAASITTPSNVNTSITGLSIGTNVFRVLVTNSFGLTGTATVTITVNPGNPVANAGTNQTITQPTSSANVSAAASVATSGTISSYLWTQISGTAATITTPSNVSTSITGLSVGTNVFQVLVTNSFGLTNTASVTITVNPGNPVAEAGANQTITLPTSSVSLDASASVATSGIITNYLWTQLSGTAATITTPSNVSTGIIGLSAGTSVFRILVTNTYGLTNTDTVTIVVNAAPPVNIPPTADAGANQNIQLPTSSVTVDASGSTDPDGTIVGYLWTKVSGGSATIVTPTTVTSLITGLTVGTYVFQVLVTDDDGETDSATMTVIVAAANIPPVADAGADQSIQLPTSQITVDASGSTDPDGTIVGYLWTQVSGTGAIIISNTSISTLITTLSAGVSVFQVLVTDNNGATGTDTMTVTVLDANLPPVADAGASQTIQLPVSQVTVDASGSTDPDGTIVSYLWTQVSGGSSTIVDDTLVSTLITGLSAGTYVFQVLVTDNNGDTSADSTTITVLPVIELPPVAEAGDNQTIQLPTDTVTVDASGSTDPDGSIVSYLWTQISGGGSPAITTPALVATNITGLTQGVFIFQVLVTDDQSLTATDTVTITVLTANVPPVAEAGANQTLLPPVSLTSIDGSGSTDPDGTIVSYSWSVISGSANIVSPSLVSSVVNTIVAGVNIIQLVVMDNSGSVDSDTVTIERLPTLLPPVANAGNDQSIFVTLPITSAVLNGSASTAGSGTITAYLWELVSGGVVTIVDPANAITDITNLESGAYTFMLTVTNSNGLTGSDTINVYVNFPDAPTVDAGADITVILPTMIATLNGSATGSNLTHIWAKLAVSPTGGVIQSDTSYQTQVTSLIEGLYFFSLTVTDEFNRTATDSVAVTVRNVTGRPSAPVTENEFAFVYSPDNYKQIIRSTIINSRVALFARNSSASSIDKAVNERVQVVRHGWLCYKIEAKNGGLAGFFILTISRHRATLGELILCTAFKKKESVVTKQINNFIISNRWRNDYL